VTDRLLAVDVGGSRVKWGIVVRGEVREVHHATTRRPFAALVEQLADVHAAFPADGWGLCMPGLLDSERGVVRLAVNLDLRDVDVVGALAEAGLPRPAAFLNDVAAAALGEAAGGTVALLQVGTGVAGRFVASGRVIGGPGGLAGEVGHLRFRREGLSCVCGLRGCVEAYGGWDGIRRRYEARGLTVRDPGSVLDEAARDPWVAAVLSEAFEALGYAAAALVAVCDPGDLRLGGGLAGAWGDTLTTSVRKVVEESVLSDVAAATRITRSTLGDRASLLGVARASGLA
jgi:glucokinase